MPSVSKAQQHVMGAARAIEEGKTKPSDSFPMAREIAKTMKPGDTHDFAATKTKGLPEHVKKSGTARLFVASHIIAANS